MELCWRKTHPFWEWICNFHLGLAILSKLYGYQFFSLFSLNIWLSFDIYRIAQKKAWLFSHWGMYLTPRIDSQTKYFWVSDFWFSRKLNIFNTFLGLVAHVECARASACCFYLWTEACNLSTRFLVADRKFILHWFFYCFYNNVFIQIAN